MFRLREVCVQIWYCTDKLGDLPYSSFDADRRVSLNNDLTYPVIGRS
jgi:hypothetical protein